MRFDLGLANASLPVLRRLAQDPPPPPGAERLDFRTDANSGYVISLEDI